MRRLFPDAEPLSGQTRLIRPGERIVNVGRKVAIAGAFVYVERDGPQGPGTHRVFDLNEARARGAKLEPAIIVDELVARLDTPVLLMNGDSLEIPVSITIGQLGDPQLASDGITTGTALLDSEASVGYHPDMDRDLRPSPARQRWLRRFFG